jgi:adenosylcobinamide kinase/adenosylcobinamide-phosphate guanylyltransferase
MRELILGGQRSGKSRTAEARAAQWLAQSPQHEALLIATAQPHDDEMRERIARHRADRAARLPRLATLEVAHDLASALRMQVSPRRMVLVDCLTLWLTQLMLPSQGLPLGPQALHQACDDVLAALRDARGPVVLVSNEIGLGVTPLGREARAFVDELGRLHQAVAAHCERVTLMMAGVALPVKTGSEVRDA